MYLKMCQRETKKDAPFPDVLLRVLRIFEHINAGKLFWASLLQ